MIRINNYGQIDNIYYYEYYKKTFFPKRIYLGQKYTNDTLVMKME